MAALRKISDRRGGIPVGVEIDEARGAPSQEIRIGSGGVGERRVPLVVVVEVDRDERAVLDLAVVGPVVSEQVTLEAAAVLEDSATARRGRAGGANGCGGEGGVDGERDPLVDVVEVPTASLVGVGGKARAKDGVQLLVVNGGEAGVAAVEFAVGTARVELAEIDGVADGNVVVDAGRAFLVGHERHRTRCGMTELEEILCGQKQFRAVGEDMVEGEVVFVIAVAGVVLPELPLIMAAGENVARLAERAGEEWARPLKSEALRAEVAEIIAELLAGGVLRRLRNHIDHAAGRSAAVDRGTGTLDDLHAVNVARAVAAEAEKTVAKLVRGGETAEVEIAADVEAGEAADVRDIVEEIEDAEVLEKLARHHIDRVRQIDDRRLDAAARHRLRRDVTADGFGADLERREFNRFGGVGARCRRGLREDRA